MESVSGESDAANNCSEAVTDTVEQNGDGDDGDCDDGGDEVGQAVGDGTEAEEQAEENVPTRLTRNSRLTTGPLRGRPTVRRLPFSPNATATGRFM